MQNKRTRLTLAAVLALALTVTAGLTLSDVASAKKKGKAGGTFTSTKNVNAPIPDAVTGPPLTYGKLTSTISVGGKKFKGMRVRDVNVTLQTIGAGINSARDLLILLTAPNGASTILFGFPGGGRSVGPLTVDDESVNAVQPSDTTPPPDPPLDPTELAEPWAGTAQPYCFQAPGGCPLALLDNGPATGTWTLTAFDGGDDPGQTSTLVFWRLNVVAGKPYKTK